MITFTCDIDWAPEEVIQDTLSIFNEFSAKCTIFATHDSPILKNCDRSLFEIGIHPNFNPLLDGTDTSRNAEKIISDLKNIFPEARGVRSHSLNNGSYFFSKFQKLGFTYEANTVLPYMSIPAPWKDWYGLWHISFNWEDDIHFSYKKKYEDIGIEDDCISKSIFNFHPVHIFLNTENEERYMSARQYYKDPDNLNKIRNRSSAKGTRDLLLFLLNKVKNEGITTHTLSEIIENKE